MPPLNQLNVKSRIEDIFIKLAAPVTDPNTGDTTSYALQRTVFITDINGVEFIVRIDQIPIQKDETIAVLKAQESNFKTKSVSLEAI